MIGLQFVTADRCNGMIEECKRIYGELLEIIRQFNRTRLNIIKIIKEDANNGYGYGSCNYSGSGSLNSILEKCRSFVNEYKYEDLGKSNPFVEGDSKAREKLAELRTSTAEKELNEDVEKTAISDPDPNVTVKEEVEIENNGPLYSEEEVDEEGDGANPYLDDNYNEDLEISTSDEEVEETLFREEDNCERDNDWIPSDSDCSDNHGDELDISGSDEDIGSEGTNSNMEEDSSDHDHQDKKAKDKALQKWNRIGRKKNKPRFTCPFCEEFVHSDTVTNRMLCKHLERCRIENNGKNKNTQEEVTKLSCHLCSKYSCPPKDVAQFVNHMLSCYSYKPLNYRGEELDIKASRKSAPLKDRIFQCSICKDSKNDKIQKFFCFDRFLKHIKKHKQFRYECSQCGKLHLNVASCQRHWRKCHQDLIDSIDKSNWQRKRNPEETSPQIPWWCNKCGEIFIDENERDKHLQNEHPTNLTVSNKEKCEHCDKTYQYQDELKLHQVSTHFIADKQQVECKDCSGIFKNQKQLTFHRRAFHKLDLFECKICGKGFTLQMRLEQHLGFHENEKKLTCSYCDKKFPRRHLVIQHEATVHEKTLSSEICGKGFSYKSTLIRHSTMVHGIGKGETSKVKGCENDDDKPKDSVVCDICGKSFVSKHRLKIHKQKSLECKRLHLSEEDATVVCDICGKRYSSKFGLAKHIRERHEGKVKENDDKPKDPVVCDICGKTFTSKDGLRIHKSRTLKCKRLHSSVEDFTVICDLCGKRYSSKFSLAKHIRERHEGKFRETCEHCGKGFEDKPKLKLHLARVHKIGDVRCVEDGCEGYVFHTQKHLEYHLAQKHGKGEAQFKCKECDKSFYFPKYLHQHVSVVHKGYRWKPKPKNG